jgi:hypothetical protein
MEDKVQMGLSPARESRHYGLLLLLLLALIAYAAIGLTFKVGPAAQGQVDGGDAATVDRHAPTGDSGSLERALASSTVSSP